MRRPSRHNVSRDRRDRSGEGDACVAPTQPPSTPHPPGSLVAPPRTWRFRIRCAKAHTPSRRAGESAREAKKRQGDLMARTLMAAALAAALLSGITAARAETLLERGRYLMGSIAACGNCHTPRGPDGQLVAGRELAGGMEFREEPFTARAP